MKLRLILQKLSLVGTNSQNVNTTWNETMSEVTSNNDMPDVKQSSPTKPDFRNTVDWATAIATTKQEVEEFLSELPDLNDKQIKLDQ